MQKEKIIYFHTGKSSFVQGDLEILSQDYIVKDYGFRPKKKSHIYLSLLSQLIFILYNCFGTKIFICMFGGYHSLFPSLISRLTGKKCIIIVGGTDCVSFPSIGYGNFKGGMLAIFTKWTFKLSSLILPVHKSLMFYDYTYDDSDFKHQGIKSFIPNLITTYTEISYGYDPEKWINPQERVKNSFITVASGLWDPCRAQLKGVDLILEIAPFFPDASFTIIGCPENIKLPIKSNNVRTYDFVTLEFLKELYNTHEFYIQVSMSEGFPNAICEAMICGCIPIGSAVGGMEDIIGDAGFILRRRDLGQFKELVDKALNCDKETYSKKANLRITNKYPKDLRREKLLNTIKSLS